MEIAPGIHRIETDVAGRVACVFLLRGAEGSVLVDTGMNYAPDANILPYLDQIRCPYDSIHRVIVTHCDFDHMGGGEALRKSLPRAQFLSHPAERIEAQSLDMLIAHRLGEFGRDHAMPETAETLAWLHDTVTPTHVDGVLTGGEVIDLGGLVAHVMVLPGHSAGHLALYVPAQKVAIVADAVLGDSLLFRDGSPAFPPTYRYPGQYQTSILELQRTPMDLMLTSHFDPMNGRQAETFLAQTQDFMDRLDRAIEAQLSEGMVWTLRDLSKVLAPEFGQWAPEAGMLICWPVLGHLERMVADGYVVCDHANGVRNYRIAGAR